MSKSLWNDGDGENFTSKFRLMKMWASKYSVFAEGKKYRQKKR